MARRGLSGILRCTRDKARSHTLITELRDAQVELEKAQARWEQALTEIEALRAS
jgi:hypothetical protein